MSTTPRSDIARNSPRERLIIRRNQVNDEPSYARSGGPRRAVGSDDDASCEHRYFLEAETGGLVVVCETLMTTMRQEQLSHIDEASPCRYLEVPLADSRVAYSGMRVVRLLAGGQDKSQDCERCGSERSPSPAALSTSSTSTR